MPALQDKTPEKKNARSESSSPAKGLPEEWLQKNRDRIAQAENILHKNWADRKLLKEDRELADQVLKVMKATLGSGGKSQTAESKSVLLLGEAGSGKTQAVEWSLNKLREEHKSLVVLKARGDAYASNVECLRHLAVQVASQLICMPQQVTSFEDSMEWFRGVLRESFKRDSAVVIILDRFEHFCGLARQTLLYNLFNLAQDLNVRICIVGISEKFNVASSLEKRIMSRFSMMHLISHLPTEMDELLKVLSHKLHLPQDCGLGADFTRDFNLRVTAALEAEASHWEGFLQMERRPSWFLTRCLPVASLLQRHAFALAGESVAKRRRIGPRCNSDGDRRQMLLEGLAECEHLVLLSLFKQHDRAPRAARNLSTVLHDLMLLVEESRGVLLDHTEDSLSAAFDRLVQLQLVRFCSAGGSISSDTPKRYLPVDCTVDSHYEELVVDLERAEHAESSGSNPLRSLPQPVQRWAVRQRN